MNSLYFIAITPDEKVSKEVTAFKNFMAVNFSSKAALSSPPHITLYPPFREKAESEKKIINTLYDFAAIQKKFEVKLNGFGCFKPKTIFIKPEENIFLNSLHSNLLKHLKSTINLFDSQNDKIYHPHITIATRDLQKSMFYKAWEIFRSKEFLREFFF